MAAFKTEYPDVMVSIHSGSASAVHNWISSGFCDTGLAMLSGEAPGIQVEPVMTMNCVAVLPKGHRLTKLKKLKPADFAGEPFISFPSSTPLRTHRRGVQGRQGRAPDGGRGQPGLIGLRAGGRGLGVALINPLAAHEEYEANGVEVRPFTPAVAVTVALLYPPYHTRTRLVSVFSRYAHQLMHEEMGI